MRWSFLLLSRLGLSSLFKLYVVCTQASAKKSTTVPSKLSVSKDERAAQDSALFNIVQLPDKP